MYRMSGKSKLIRLSLLPLWIPFWVVGLVILTLNLAFDKLWIFVDTARDRFESWVNKIAPLD